MPKDNQEDTHVPVLLEETLQLLQPRSGESYLDLTAGYGGHASAVIDRTGEPKKAVLVDRDGEAVAALHRRFGDGPEIIHSDFLSAAENLAGQGRQFDIILADLGTSSPHFDKAERGFAFSQAGPLDMRMDRRSPLTADELVNNASETELTDILGRYGEEPRASRIARAIIAHRPVRTTDELARIIAQVSGHRFRRKVHPATRSFQALRIAVNDELDQLEKVLPVVLELLAPAGRLAVISFHSLEDRIVKNFMLEHAGDTYDAELQSLTKKPITAGKNETVLNPRARSAKLRVCRKK